MISWSWTMVLILKQWLSVRHLLTGRWGRDLGSFKSFVIIFATYFIYGNVFLTPWKMSKIWQSFLLFKIDIVWYKNINGLLIFARFTQLSRAILTNFSIRIRKFKIRKQNDCLFNKAETMDASDLQVNARAQLNIWTGLPRTGLPPLRLPVPLTRTGFSIIYL